MTEFDIEKKSGDVVLKKYNGDEGHVTVPDGVTIIDTCAFSGMTMKVRSSMAAVAFLIAFAFIFTCATDMSFAADKKTVYVCTKDAQTRFEGDNNTTSTDSSIFRYNKKGQLKSAKWTTVDYDGSEDITSYKYKYKGSRIVSSSVKESGWYGTVKYTYKFKYDNKGNVRRNSVYEKKKVRYMRKFKYKNNVLISADIFEGKHKIIRRQYGTVKGYDYLKEYNRNGHLTEWYVFADEYDRNGNIKVSKWYNAMNNKDVQKGIITDETPVAVYQTYKYKKLKLSSKDAKRAKTQQRCINRFL